MNKIIRNLVDDFLKNEEIKPSKDESKNFEDFCNFSIISSEYKSDFSTQDVNMGDTQGIDGLAVIVNGNLVTNIEEIDDLVNHNNYIEATFVFIQAKNSESFNGAEISNFFLSILDFFKEEPKYTKTTEIRRAIALKDRILAYLPKMKNGKPNCNIYYVTKGVWSNDESLKSRFEDHRLSLVDLSFFQDIKIIPCGANEIQEYYMQTKRITNCKFTFDKQIVLPVESGVKEAYFGIVKFEEFRKIISDNDDKIKDIFYENVRNFLGETNTVNREIEKTLENKEFGVFCILNNGVTIVANTKTNTGSTFSIENYQVVNGCQTSHVLFNNRKAPGIDQVYVPLKLIITNDDGIQSKIIVATNNQTSIPKEQLEAFSRFQKNLELYYQSEKNQNAKLFYERRQKQYRDKDVNRPRIVTIREQIKSFAAMFLDQPHIASGYFSRVYKDNKEEMFIDSHKFFPYYISSFAMYKLESLFQNGLLDKKYRIARYHILMIFRMTIEKTTGGELPRLNSRDIDNYCENVRTILLDDKKVIEYFRKAISILDSVDSISMDDQKTLYLSENSEAIKGKITKIK